MEDYPIYYGLIDKKDYKIHLYRHQGIEAHDLSEVAVLLRSDLERLLKIKHEERKTLKGIYDRSGLCYSK